MHNDGKSFNAKAIQHMLTTVRSSHKLKKLLNPPKTATSYMTSYMKTEKSPDSKMRNISQQTLPEIQTSNFNTNIQRLDRSIKRLKLLSRRGHEEIKNKFLDQDQIYNVVHFFKDDKSPTKELGKVQLEQRKDPNYGVNQLTLRIKEKISQRDQDFRQRNQEKLNKIQFKIANIQASSIFKQFILQHGYRQPDFLKNVIIKK